MGSASSSRLRAGLVKAAVGTALGLFIWAHAGIARAGSPVTAPTVPPVSTPAVTGTANAVTGATQAAAAPAVSATTSTVTAAKGTATKTVEHVSRSLPKANPVVSGAVETATRAVTHAVGSVPAPQRSTSSPAAATTTVRIVRAPHQSGRRRLSASPRKRTNLTRPAQFVAPLSATPAPTWTGTGPQLGALHAPNRPGHPPPPVPGPTTSAPAAGAASGSSGGGLLAALLLVFILAVPNAGRWLRPALALGLTPVTISPGDRPG
jgi:hypothetical protein